MKKNIIEINSLLRALSSSECMQLVEKLHAVISTCIEDSDSYFDYIWEEYGNGARWEICNHYHAQNIDILNKQLQILSGTNEDNLNNITGDTFDIMPLLFETDDITRDEIIQSLTNKIDEVIKSGVNDNNRKDMDNLYHLLQNATNLINNTYKRMYEEIRMAEKEMVTSCAATNYKVAI